MSSPMPGINSSHHPHLPHHPAAQFGDAGMGDGDERELSEMHGMEELVECMSAEDAAIALRRRKWHKGGGSCLIIKPFRTTPASGDTRHANA